MNRLDSFIGWISPKWAAERDRARAMSMQFRAQYDIAKQRRGADGWITPSSSANTEIGPALVMSRNRARDLVRNNTYAARIVDVWTAHIVGDGITAAWRDSAKAPDQIRQDVWKRWAEDGESDADGELDFYGQQQLAIRQVVESGESLMRIRTRRPSDGLAVPMQLQTLEADHLDHDKNATLPNNGAIRLGIQFDALGRREGYWLYRNHPGDNIFSFQRSSVFVPASQMVHLYRKKRAGQVRGITWLAAAANKIRDLDDYHDALIMKAKIESCLTGWIKSSSGDLSIGEQEIKPDSDLINRMFETLEPGTVGRLNPDEEITFSQPSSSGSHEAITRQFEQSIAVAAGITYDQLTGDLRGANYSSLRAGKIEFRRDLSQTQWQMMIPMFCEPVARAFNDLGIAAGKWRDDGSSATWMPPRNEPIDPKKDTEAEQADMTAGLETWSSTVAKRGYDPRTLAEAHKADEEMLKGLGLQRFITGAAPAAALPAPMTDEGNQDNEDDTTIAAA